MMPAKQAHAHCLVRNTGTKFELSSWARAQRNALGWSVELCGGTHVHRTGDIGLISVTGESAVASGVRRIEALTGNYARHHANGTIQIAKSAAAELRTPLDEMPARIAALMEERKKLERELADARKNLAMGGGVTGVLSVTEAGDTADFRGEPMTVRSLSGK